jgi:alkylhydroperoxidase/carboxymuconolactone decarboxylase family protein YurZ
MSIVENTTNINREIPKTTNEKEKFLEILQRVTELSKQCRELIKNL